MSTGIRTALTARGPATRRGTHGSTVRHRRVTSLDSARGLLLVVNIAAISVLAPVPDQLRHAKWDGVT